GTAQRPHDTAGDVRAGAGAHGRRCLVSALPRGALSRRQARHWIRGEIVEERPRVSTRAHVTRTAVSRIVGRDQRGHETRLAFMMIGPAARSFAVSAFTL